MKPLILEAVIVCVNYSDFLTHTIIHNIHHFDKLVVVTDYQSEDSKKVLNICNHYNVTCLQTDDFYGYEAAINKAAGINKGLSVLSKQGWVIQLDADIILPPMFRVVLQNTHHKLNSKGIYGVDRFMIKSFEQYMEFLSNPTVQHDGWVFVNPPKDIELGSRFAQYYGEGYTPIGFFQMWNPIETGINTYPVDSIGADRTDVLFAKLFEPKNRALLPEVFVLHLESEEARMGTNWFGRKTKRFFCNNCN